MRVNEHDILSSDYICTIGKRLNAYNGMWEVYASLANGGEFMFGWDGTEAEAVGLVIEARKAAEGQGQQFYLTEGGQHVNIYNIVRIYIDKNVNSQAVFVEDASGRQWIVYSGDMELCLVVLNELANEAMTNTGEFHHDN